MRTEGRNADLERRIENVQYEILRCAQNDRKRRLDPCPINDKG
jgi:hypothetical protein